MSKRLFLGIGAGVVSIGMLAVVLSARTREPAEEAAAPPKSAVSKIVQVTVYPNSALVTREVEVPAGNGQVELVVTPLPEHTINSSLYSEGSDGIRVLTTRFRTRPVKEDTREEVRKLEDQIKQLQFTQAKIQAEIATLQKNAAMLDKLEGFTTTSTTHATEKGKLDSDATIALAKYLMEGRTEKTRELVTLNKQSQDNQEQMQFLRRQLNDLTAGTSRHERDAVIVVDKNNQAAGKVRLNYLVDAASWNPQYKLRAGKETKEAVQIEYLAAIMQQTGEDWTGVNMILSTAQPMLNATPPTLQMLAINIVPRGTAVAGSQPIPNQQPGRPGQPVNPTSGFGGTSGPQGGPGTGAGGRFNPNFEAPKASESRMNLDNAAKIIRQQAQDDFNQKKEISGLDLYNSAAAIEQAADLVLDAAPKPVPKGFTRSSNNEGPSVIYHLASKLSVPSRNEEQVIEVAKIDITPDYFYKAVPVLTRHVYRQANLTNNSKHVLLPGEATMYIGSDFVGRMDLPLVAIGETFIAGFGVDPQMQVQRNMIDKQRTTQGGNQVLKFEYRILVSSFKPEKVKLQVWDRLPHAEGETVGVSLVKAAPELCKDALYQREERVNNLLRWDVEVDPSMTGEKAFAINYEFKMELDKNMAIGTFMTK